MVDSTTHQQYFSRHLTYNLYCLFKIEFAERVKELDGEFIYSSVVGLSWFLPRLSAEREHIILQPAVNQHDVDLRRYDMVVEGKQPMNVPIYNKKMEPGEVFYKMSDPMMVMVTRIVGFDGKHFTDKHNGIKSLRWQLKTPYTVYNKNEGEAMAHYVVENLICAPLRVCDLYKLNDLFGTGLNENEASKDNTDYALQDDVASFLKTFAGGKFQEKDWVREWLQNTKIQFDEFDQDYWQLRLRRKIQSEIIDQVQTEIGIVLVDGLHRLTFGSNCHEHWVIDKCLDLDETERYVPEEVP